MGDRDRPKVVAALLHCTLRPKLGAALPVMIFCRAYNRCRRNWMREMPVPLHHPNSFTIGANPGGSIAYTPFVFLKAVSADHETAGAAPAKFLLFSATVTDIITASPSPVATFSALPRHFSTFPQAQSRYASFTLSSSLVMTSGNSYG